MLLFTLSLSCTFFWAVFPCLIGRVARYTHSSDMKKHHQNNVQYNGN